MLNRLLITNLERSKAAKQSLRPLPVIEGGVRDITITSLHAVKVAANEAMKRARSPRARQHTWQAAIWIAYRCSDYGVPDVAMKFGRTEPGCRRAVIATEQRLRDRDYATQTAVDCILQFIDEGVVEELPAERPKQPADVRPSDPEIDQVRYWRSKGFTVKGISKRTGIPCPKVAKVLGVMWGGVE